MKQPELFPNEEQGLFHFEEEARKQGCFFVAGVDEAGRGPLAGPVVAAAVILPQDYPLPQGVNDSKKLSAAQRARLFTEIKENKHIRWATGIVDAQKIDEINILQATYLAMKKAVVGLGEKVDFCLVDGLPVHGLPVDHKAIVKGDSRSYSIAAASIIAKETRDEMMVEYSLKYPGYGFEKHKGYGTKAHMEALMKNGPCPIHRVSFEPVRKAKEANE
ncbi:MAG: ribonuclease HII [Lentisphaeraceae bacterium]|nr:ribonuclease HII [Lentisphaeraceae bacterium]